MPFHATPPEGPLKLRFILQRGGPHPARAHPDRPRPPRTRPLADHFGGAAFRAASRVVLTRHLAKSPSSWFSRRFLLGQCDALIAVSHFVAKVLREGVYEPDSPEPERRARPPLLGTTRRFTSSTAALTRSASGPWRRAAQRQAWGLAPEHFAFGVSAAIDLPRGKGQREFLQAAARMLTGPAGAVPDRRPRQYGQILQADIERLGLSGKAWLTPIARTCRRP